jgi:hypothetical protein
MADVSSNYCDCGSEFVVNVLQNCFSEDSDTLPRPQCWYVLH